MATYLPVVARPLIVGSARIVHGNLLFTNVAGDFQVVIDDWLVKAQLLGLGSNKTNRSDVMAFENLKTSHGHGLFAAIDYVVNLLNTALAHVVKLTNVDQSCGIKSCI